MATKTKPCMCRHCMRLNLELFKAGGPALVHTTSGISVNETCPFVVALCFRIEEVLDARRLSRVVLWNWHWTPYIHNFSSRNNRRKCLWQRQAEEADYQLHGNRTEKFYSHKDNTVGATLVRAHRTDLIPTEDPNAYDHLYIQCPLSLDWLKRLHAVPKPSLLAPPVETPEPRVPEPGDTNSTTQQQVDSANTDTLPERLSKRQKGELSVATEAAAAAAAESQSSLTLDFVTGPFVFIGNVPAVRQSVYKNGTWSPWRRMKQNRKD